MGGEEPNLKVARLVASYLLSLSLFAVAAALVYFTVEITTVSKQIPDILLSINNTSEKIEPVVNEVGNIVELVPPILKEIEATRKLIPPILKEVEQTRLQIPLVLKEAEAVRGELPAVLASADRASAAVVTISNEVAATRPLIPDVLAEVETTRESIPPMMETADKLIEKARVAGREASQGAVTGLFKGIITAPFVLVGDVGRRIAGVSEEDAKKYSKEDFDLIETASLDLLNNGKRKDVRKWNNPDSGNHGVVTLSLIYTDDSGNECRTLKLTSFSADGDSSKVARSLCKNDDDKWDFDD